MADDIDVFAATPEQALVAKELRKHYPTDDSGRHHVQAAAAALQALDEYTSAEDQELTGQLCVTEADGLSVDQQSRLGAIQVLLGGLDTRVLSLGQLDSLFPVAELVADYIRDGKAAG